MVKFW